MNAKSLLNNAFQIFLIFCYIYIYIYTHIVIKHGEPEETPIRFNPR